MYTYFVLNKPKSMLSQFKGQYGLNTLKQLDYQFDENVMPVGRLDYDTEGLLLLTTDKNFYKKILLPEVKINKTYLVRVKNNITQKAINLLQNGVDIKLKGKDCIYKTKPCFVEIISKNELPTMFYEDYVWPHTWLKITITEGKNRQVRKMFSVVGFNVQRLIRVQIGGLNISNIPVSTVQQLDINEVNSVFLSDKNQAY
ncbi:MAG: pseudouridine synthase [Bacteroidetes bacterium]|nr:pseudouridine synthase [Bacteroidota bacterium]